YTTLFRSEIAEVLEQLVGQDILRRDEANIIDIDDIENFFATDIAEYKIACPTIYREIPFSLTLSAQEVYSTWKGNYDEQVLIQGVLDCVIPKDDGWLILDYKTDVIDEEVTEETVNKFAERYEVQLNLYRTALERIWKEPVKET